MFWPKEDEDVCSEDKLVQLKKHANINWEIEQERREFLSRVASIIYQWNGPLPNLREIFRTKEIEFLLSDSINRRYAPQYRFNGEFIIDFVACTGYKDEPEIDEDGKPILRRTTPLHYAVKPYHEDLIDNLFEIYDKFDVNYIDESGLSHFHVACQFGRDEIVKKFLELGQDPNFPARESVDPPLNLALYTCKAKVARLLLENGADPTVAGKNGLTALHIYCKIGSLFKNDLAPILFEPNNSKLHPVQVNAKDKLGYTPLLYAVGVIYDQKIVRVLLEKGADPNSVTEEGWNSLHVICMKIKNCDYLEMFFDIIDEFNQSLQIDARDKMGRTPLQWAVACLESKTVDILLNRGADLSSFVFPPENHFQECFQVLSNKCLLFQLPIMVKHIEKKGYEFKQRDFLTVVKLFIKYGFFKTMTDLDECLRSNKYFVDWAKNTTLNSSLSVYDLVQLPLKKVAKLITYTDYFEFEEFNVYDYDPDVSCYEAACAAYLCEVKMREFFRRWAIEFFSEMTSHQLPILCCERIMDQLINEDLSRICLAALGQSSCNDSDELICSNYLISSVI